MPIFVNPKGSYKASISLPHPCFFGKNKKKTHLQEYPYIFPIFCHSANRSLLCVKMRASKSRGSRLPRARSRWLYCLCLRSWKAACTVSCAAAPCPLPVVFTPAAAAPRVAAGQPLWWPPRRRLAARRPEPAARSSWQRLPRPAAPVQLHARGCLLLFCL